jgi:hypothetical protein
MPINIVDYSNTKDGERGDFIAHLCDEYWEMPIQVETFEKWLVEKGASLLKGKYIADIGFCPRSEALGGGVLVTSKAMEIMVSIGMELYFSEYPEQDDE